MKIAITAEGQDLPSAVDQRFGRAKWILVVDTETGQAEAHDNKLNLNLAQGAGIQTGQNVANLGVEAVLTGNMGPNAFKTLVAANVRVFLAPAKPVEEVIAAFKQGQLQELQQANVEGHWV